ncbi:PREDICTED: rab11 family-interacting protein 2 [Gekko japonicus]|uniref:Rab11 family-interacting protein 2 n=1 Tax=Gekko japonicus TaxID=146911 RepID=A0ABM1KMA6_GEKJA|nr:PREDICTED: rab11 family-interacting protein 2 [Gekko japonicus]
MSETMLAEQTQKWFPTHVQVTVLQAKGLKPKGKGGTNDTYTIIQLGKEKYSTSVAEKTLDPVWKEEASFELPGLLMEGNSEKYILCLIVMHRSLVGLDKFLGQVAINLNDIFEDKLRRKTEWFSLESKQGKRTKDRGEIKVNIQFMRNNMTASMFDLSMKDKTKSPFAKLKDKMKGRKTDGTLLDTSSAIIPSTHTPETSAVTSLSEIQLKSKPKKPFLLGPQRLSSAHSMSDLTGPQVSSEKIKSGTVGNPYLFRHQLESVGSVDEGGTFDFDPTNPFTSSFKPTNTLSSSSLNVNPSKTEDLRKAADGNPFDATAVYRNLTYEEVLQELVKHKEQLKKKDTHIRELEDYIDNLLVRVMEETPSILRVPYEPSRRAGKFSKS